MKTRKKKNRIKDRSVKKKNFAKPKIIQQKKKQQDNKKQKIQQQKQPNQKQDSKKEIPPFSELLDFQNIKQYYNKADLPNKEELFQIQKNKQYLKCGFKIFPLINQNQQKQIHCIYSRTLLLEDDKQYKKFNREHSFPLYYIKYQNKEFFNDFVHIFPVQQEANYQRANRYYYCPTKEICQCDLKQEQLSNIGDLYRNPCKYDVFDLLEYFLYDIYNEIYSKEFKQNLHKNQTKQNLLLKKDDFGYLYLGSPGYFCPKNNIGPLARACLYSLLFYKELFIEDRLNFINIEFLQHKAFTEKVEQWEKKRNHKIYYVQKNRNPFVDFPELAKNLNFFNNQFYLQLQCSLFKMKKQNKIMIIQL